MPLKARKASDMSPAVIRAMGTPRKTWGMGEMSKRSRMDEMITRARVKPTPVARPKTTDLARP